MNKLDDGGYKALLAAANAFDRLPEDSGGLDLTPGEVYAANATRFNQAHHKEFLTNYAVSWIDDQGLDASIEFIAPSVQVPHYFEYDEFPNEEAFVSDVNTDDDLRAIGGNFKEVRYTSTKTTTRTYNRGLTMILDVEETVDMPNWKQHYTSVLMQRLKRNHLRRAWVLLLASGTNEALTWDTTAGKDPDLDIAQRYVTYKNSAGLPPNRVMYTSGAWIKRLIAARAQTAAGGVGSSIITSPEMLGQFLRMQVMVSEEVYQTGTSTKTAIQGSSTDSVVMFRASPGGSRNDPSNFKNFWTPCPASGQRYAVYVQEDLPNPKLKAITVEHYSNLVATTTAGIRELTVS